MGQPKVMAGGKKRPLVKQGKPGARKPGTPGPPKPGGTGGAATGGGGKALDVASEAKDIYAIMRKEHGDIKIPRASAVDIGLPTDGVLTGILEGEKDASKTCALGLWPIPEGTRRVFLSFDETTRDSLINYYGPEIMDEVEVYEMVKRIKDENGKVIYPGFDPAKPITATKVIAATFQMLEALEKDGNVGQLVMDHFQALYEQIGTGHTVDKAGILPTDRISLDEWGPRTGAMNIIEAKTRRVPVDGGSAWITGYAPQPKEQYKDIPDPNRPGVMVPDKNDPSRMVQATKRIVVKELKSPTWLKDNIKRNWKIHIHLKSEETDETDEDGNLVQYYTATVKKSKTPLFPKGGTRDITNRNLNVFYDEYVARINDAMEADKELPDEEPDASPEEGDAKTDEEEGGDSAEPAAEAPQEATT